MRSGVILTTQEADALIQLGQQVKRARLRRNLSQAELAVRVGITRKVVVALEAGEASSGVAVLLKVMSVLGYPDRLTELLRHDPIGDDLEEVHGRQRAGRRREDGVADF